MKQFALVTLFFFAAVGQAAPTGVDKFFEHLKGSTGEYHRATVVLQASPKSDPTDMEMHGPKDTLRAIRLNDDKYVLQTFNFENAEATATSQVFERKNGGVELTHYDLNVAANSYHVKARVGQADGSELSFYRSEVSFLDNSEEAKSVRKAADGKRQLGLAGLVLVLTLAGEKVPAEVIENDNWIEVAVVNRHSANPITFGNVLLDPKGKSERNPLGEPNLTILQVFHKGH